MSAPQEPAAEHLSRARRQAAGRHVVDEWVRAAESDPVFAESLKEPKPWMDLQEWVDGSQQRPEQLGRAAKSPSRQKERALRPDGNTDIEDVAYWYISAALRQGKEVTRALFDKYRLSQERRNLESRPAPSRLAMQEPRTMTEALVVARSFGPPLPQAPQQPEPQRTLTPLERAGSASPAPRFAVREGEPNAPTPVRPSAGTPDFLRSGPDRSPSAVSNSSDSLYRADEPSDRHGSDAGRRWSVNSTNPLTQAARSRSSSPVSQNGVLKRKPAWAIPSETYLENTRQSTPDRPDSPGPRSGFGPVSPVATMIAQLRVPGSSPSDPNNPVSPLTTPVQGHAQPVSTARPRSLR